MQCVTFFQITDDYLSLFTKLTLIMANYGYNTGTVVKINNTGIFIYNDSEEAWDVFK